jgi:hypothetical protein
MTLAMSNDKALRTLGVKRRQGRKGMNIFYIVGVVVVALAVLGFLGLR